MARRMRKRLYPCPPVVNGYCGVRGFRSPHETRFRDVVESLGRRAIFEPCMFIMSTGRGYIPDFYIPEEDRYYEIVSTLDYLRRNVNKYAEFEASYPGVAFTIVVPDGDLFKPIGIGDIWG